MAKGHNKRLPGCTQFVPIEDDHEEDRPKQADDASAEVDHPAARGRA